MTCTWTQIHGKILHLGVKHTHTQLRSYHPFLCPCGPSSMLQSHLTWCLGLCLHKKKQQKKHLSTAHFRSFVFLIVKLRNDGVNAQNTSIFSNIWWLTNNAIGSFSYAVELLKLSDTSAAAELKKRERTEALVKSVNFTHHVVPSRRSCNAGKILDNCGKWEDTGMKKTTAL